MSKKQKTYKYSLSFDEEMGEWFEQMRDNFRKRSVSKTVQSFLEPAFKNWQSARQGGSGNVQQQAHGKKIVQKGRASGSTN